MRTATEPARSLPKWSAFDDSAALTYRRDAFHETSVRLASMPITMKMIANAYQVVCT